MGIGARRWVLHPELAQMLARAGARVDRLGSWIGLSCTGNRGRRDDPEYVAAFLRHGARANDRRLTGQANDGARATALHYAAKAGFVKTIAVLFENGADPSAKDDNALNDRSIFDLFGDNEVIGLAEIENRQSILGRRTKRRTTSRSTDFAARLSQSSGVGDSS